MSFVNRSLTIWVRLVHAGIERERPVLEAEETGEGTSSRAETPAVENRRSDFAEFLSTRRTSRLTSKLSQEQQSAMVMVHIRTFEQSYVVFFVSHSRITDMVVISQLCNVLYLLLLAIFVLSVG
jgi:hypothetical protein